VSLQINDCYAEHGKFMVVTGGAQGASQIAEAVAQEFGLPIVSFRPVQINEENFGVDEWRMYRGDAKIIRDEITWRDWQSAANFRSLLVADRCDEAYVYWDGYSRGTAYEIEMLQNENRPFFCANLRMEQAH
jgi:hypothetical protein